MRVPWYAIRNTHYSNPVKLYCVIRNSLPQYAIGQYAAYGVCCISLSNYTVNHRCESESNLVLCFLRLIVNNATGT
jgi:hypothetical protein